MRLVFLWRSRTNVCVQGMFGDKQATIERFKEVYKTKLTDEIRERLVLENDEVSPRLRSSCFVYLSALRCATIRMIYFPCAKNSISPS